MKLIDGKAIAAKIEEEIKAFITPPTPSYLKRGQAPQERGGVIFF